MLESADFFVLSKMISFGNRSDVDEADMIWYAANDPQTKVIGLYVEGSVSYTHLTLPTIYSV